MRRINIVILLCILSSVFFWILSPNESEAVFSYFVSSGENLLQGKVSTTVTALFLHADPLHLVGNMLFLFVFGNTLEEEIGSKKTLAAFFSGGILSFLFSVFFYSPQTSMIGASAAIFTLTSIVMLVKPLRARSICQAATPPLPLLLTDTYLSEIRPKSTVLDQSIFQSLTHTY